MKKVLSPIQKDYIREIKNSKARFLSIFTLVALGVFVLVGLTVSGSIIRESLETFIKDSNTHDLSLMVFQGLEEKDKDLIGQLSGKKEEEYLRVIDIQSKSDAYNFRIKSLPEKLSLPRVEEGRLPKKKGEIFLDESLKKNGYKLGEVIEFRKEKNKFDPEADDRLYEYSYKIVGFGKSIEFLDEVNKGRSKDGGSLDGFAYIVPENFADKSFQQYNVQFKNLTEEKTWTKNYQKKVDVHRQELESLLEDRPEERLEKSVSDFEQEIKDGQEEIEEGKEDLEQGKKDLEEAKKELEKSEKELAEAKSKLETGILEGQNQQKQAQIDLLEGEKSILENENKLQQGQSALNQGKAQIAQEKSQLESKAEEVTQGMTQLKTLLIGVEKGQEEIERQKNQIDQSLQELEEKEKNSSLPYSIEEIQKIKKHILELKLRKADLLTRSLPLKNQALEARNKADKMYKDLPQNVMDQVDSQPLSYTGDNEPTYNWFTSDLEEGSFFTNKSSIDKPVEESRGWFDFFTPLFTNKDSYFFRDSDIDYSFVDQNRSETEDEPETEEIEVAEEDLYLNDLNLDKEYLYNQGLTEEEVQILRQYKEAKKEAEEKEALLRENEEAREEITREIKQEEEKLHEQSQAILQSGQIFNGLEIGQITSQSLIKVQKRILLEQKKQLDLAQRTLDFAKEATNPQKEALEDGQRKIDQGRKQLNAAEAELAKQEGALLQGQNELEAGRKKIAQGKAELEKGTKELEEQKKAGEKKIQQGQEELAKGKEEYQEGKEEYQKEYPKALEEIANGEKDLEKAKDILKILEDPSYTITPRSEDTMLYRVFDNAIRVDNLAKIFPIFFFAVAMLLCSTTMNRMVEEERINIGTYKALGYSNKAIAGKYISYGVLAASIGGVLGGLAGNYLLGYMIAKAYTTGNAIPDLIVALYPWQNIIAIVLGALATGLVAYLTVRKSVKQNASTLMRPKAPKHGTRILIERIPFIWNRMGFLQKVTARNIFRYKKRMLMTILGVMGCVALLVLGFGIQSSIDGLVEKQFGKLTPYDMIIIHERALDKDAFQEYQNKLKEDSRIKNFADARLETVEVPYEDGLDPKITTIIPSKDNGLDQLILLRERKSEEPIELDGDGVVITEKLADLLDFKKGDLITFTTDEDYQVSLKISGITEGYAGHFMYMTRDVYEVAFGEDYKENIDLVEVFQKDKKDVNKIEEEYTENDSVLSVLDLSDIKVLIEQLTGSIGQIVVIIIVASTLLAMVVLFTLTNINIQERKRELSTIKVLGFYPKELTSYVYRETGTLSLMGIFLGFIVGKILHYNVMRIVVPDESMMDPELHLMNYLIPGLITLGISIVVCLIVHQTLKRINMVEALKAVE